MPTPELSKRLMLLVLLAACGGGGSSGPDAAAETVDSGSPGVDSGTTQTDAGSSITDAGASGGDAGTPIDAGTAVDAGTPVVDAGQNDAGQTTVDAGPGPFDDAGIALATRNAAAKATAENAALCVAVKPFYWEVGDVTGALVSGSVQGTGPKVYEATSAMSIASASKWFYSSYWVQRTNGVLTADDIKFFNFYSGYTNFNFCSPNDTVSSCLDGNSGTLDPSTEGKFAYGGGHMQKHASLNGLGTMNATQLATEILSQVGSDIAFSYNSPQLAGGGDTSAAEYAKLLRKIISGQLVMRSILGTHAVCTDPDTCPNAVNSPAPPNEQWHYSIGHWVEDDPTIGDGAFSSPGAFGFYPWVDKTKTIYGILARNAGLGAISSVKCGRLIRKAWVTGVAQN